MKTTKEAFIKLNKISEKFHAWARGWRVFILFLADALMMGYIMPVAAGIMALAANNSVLPLDLMFFYTPQQAFNMIEKYAECLKQWAQEIHNMSLVGRETLFVKLSAIEAEDE
jgi:hypothetical protein